MTAPSKHELVAHSAVESLCFMSDELDSIFSMLNLLKEKLSEREGWPDHDADAKEWREMCYRLSGNARQVALSINGLRSLVGYMNQSISRDTEELMEQLEEDNEG